MIIWLQLGLIVTLGIGLGVFVMWARGRTRTPYIIDLILGTIALIIGIVGLVAGHRLMPIYFILSAMVILYQAVGAGLTQLLRHGRLTAPPSDPEL